MTVTLPPVVTLPAASVLVAVNVADSASSTVAAHAPLAFAVVVATTVEPLRTSTVEPASAVPTTVWVVLFVVTSAVVIATVDGFVVSIAPKIADAVPMLPAASVSVARTMTTSLPVN